MLEKWCNTRRGHRAPNDSFRAVESRSGARTEDCQREMNMSNLADFTTGEGLKIEQLFNRLTFVCCELSKSSMRIETTLDAINGRLASLEALAQQRNDWIRKERSE